MVGFEERALYVIAPFLNISSKQGVSASLIQLPAPSTPIMITCEYFLAIVISPEIQIIKRASLVSLGRLRFYVSSIPCS
jgi:hypothetical protein